MIKYKAQLANGQWVYPLDEKDNRQYVGAEIRSLGEWPSPRFLLADEGVVISWEESVAPVSIGYRKASQAIAYSQLPDFVTVENWAEITGQPLLDDDENWHPLIESGVYVPEYSAPGTRREVFDTSVYEDAPFDLSVAPEPDPNPDWPFQVVMGYAVFGALYARLCPGHVSGVRDRLRAEIEARGGRIQEVTATGFRGIVELPYADGRRVRVTIHKYYRALRPKIKTHAFTIHFMDLISGNSKEDAISNAKAAIEEALAPVPFSLATCATCDGNGVVWVPGPRPSS